MRKEEKRGEEKKKSRWKRGIPRREKRSFGNGEEEGRGTVRSVEGERGRKNG